MEDILRQLLDVQRQMLAELRIIRRRLESPAAGGSAGTNTAHPGSESATAKAQSPAAPAQGAGQALIERLNRANRTKQGR